MTTGTAKATGERADTGAGWRRLSRRMLLIHPVQELVRALPAVVVALVAGTTTGNGGWWGLAMSMVAVAFAPIRWFTTRYRITPDQVQLRHGVVIRKVTTVPRERIRTVDVTSHAAHRLLGLAKVVVGTGRAGSREELTLDAMTLPAAYQLRDELFATIPAGAGGNADAERELIRFRPGWLVFGPYSTAGFLFIGALAISFNELLPLVERWGPVHRTIEDLHGPRPWPTIVLIALGVVALAAVINVVSYALRFWNFRLVHTPGGTVRMTHGLLSLHAVTVEERRLRGVEITESLALRWLGAARGHTIATGLPTGRGGRRREATLLTPAAPRDEVRAVAEDLLDQPGMMRAPLVRHGAAARSRRISRAATAYAVIVAALAAAGPGHLAPGRLVPQSAWWIGALLLAGPAVALALDRYRNLGHGRRDDLLVGSSGSLVRRRWALRTEGLIGWNLRRSPWQRRAGLVTAVATTAAGRQGYHLIDIRQDTALRLAEFGTPGLLAPFLQGGPPLQGASSAGREGDS